MLEMMAIRLALKQAITFIHHSCIMISTDNKTVVSYISKHGGIHSPNLCVEVWEILNWCLEHDIVIRVRHIPDKFNILADRLSRLDKPIKTEWALDQTVANSLFQMLNFPNVDLFATRFNHKLPLCLSSTRQQSTSDRCPVHGLESSSCICFSSFYSDSCCSGKYPTTSVQNSSDCSVLATATVVLRTSSLSVSSDSSATISKSLDSIKRKICSQNLPLLDLHAWELSNSQSEIKNFRKTLQILSLDQEEHLHKKSTMQNGPSSLIGVIQKRLIRSRPLLQL